MPLELLVHKVLQVLVIYPAPLVQLGRRVQLALAEYQVVLDPAVPLEPQEHSVELQPDK